ncbi:hypothetical protein BKA57DRAFT_465705, partial [Linnemannia elongata]
MQLNPAGLRGARRTASLEGTRRNRNEAPILAVKALSALFHFQLLILGVNGLISLALEQLARDDPSMQGCFIILVFVLLLDNPSGTLFGKLVSKEGRCEGGNSLCRRELDVFEGLLGGNDLIKGCLLLDSHLLGGGSVLGDRGLLGGLLLGIGSSLAAGSKFGGGSGRSLLNNGFLGRLSNTRFESTFSLSLSLLSGGLGSLSGLGNLGGLERLWNLDESLALFGFGGSSILGMSNKHLGGTSREGCLGGSDHSIPPVFVRFSLIIVILFVLVSRLALSLPLFLGIIA